MTSKLERYTYVNATILPMNIPCHYFEEDSPHPIIIADTIFCIHRSTRSFSSLPALKNGNFFGLILTLSPVLGFRPVYDLYFLTKNEQRPRISTRSPFTRASTILSKKRVTIFSASDLERLFESFSAWMRSTLFIRSELLCWLGMVLKPYGRKLLAR